MQKPQRVTKKAEPGTAAYPAPSYKRGSSAPTKTMTRTNRNTKTTAKKDKKKKTENNKYSTIAMGDGLRGAGIHGVHPVTGAWVRHLILVPLVIHIAAALAEAIDALLVLLKYRGVQSATDHT